MRKWTAALALVAILAAVAAAPGAAAPRFQDIAGHWAEADILAAASAGWAGGYPDGNFRPDRTVTRAEALAFIVKALTAARRIRPLGPTDTFLPAALAHMEAHWAMQAGTLPTAYATGLLTDADLPGDRFSPDPAATRLEATVWLARAADPALEARLSYEHAFGDGWPEEARAAVALPLRNEPWPFADTVPAGQQIYVLAAYKAGIVSGFQDGRFRGAEPVTRAQLVAMAGRLAPVAALAGGPAALPAAAPAHPVHGRVSEVTWQRRYSLPRPSLSGDRPEDWPAIARLLAALATAEAVTPPPGVGDLPFTPPGRDYLVITYADGGTDLLYGAVRCQASDAGVGFRCGHEPDWLLVNREPRHSSALWEYYNGQMQLDMPWVIDREP